jgi:hypothetical protein
VTTTAVQPLDDTRRAELVETLTTDGIIGLKGAFAPEWADVLGEDVMAAFEEAKVREGGAIGRGPQRWYVEVHPEQIRGFADLAGHPWIVQVATEVLGATTRSSRSASTSRSPARWTSPGTATSRWATTPAGCTS